MLGAELVGPLVCVSVEPDLAACFYDFGDFVRKAFCRVSRDEPCAAVCEVELAEHADESWDTDFGGEEAGGVIGEDVVWAVAGS